MEIIANGIKLHYEVSGRGMPVILLHGNGGSIEELRALIDRLSLKYCVYAVDTRSHGGSERTDDMHYSLMCDDIYEFIKKLNIVEPVLIGFSDGGIVGLLLAIKYNKLLSRLVVCGANASPIGLLPSFIKRTKDKYGDNAPPLISLMLNEPNIKKEDLKKISAPTLVLAGEHDLILRRHTKMIAKSIPNSKCIIIEGEDHGSYVISGKVVDYIENEIQ